VAQGDSVFDRRLRAGRLRAFACDVLRSVSRTEGGGVRIEVDDRAARERIHLHRAPPRARAPRTSVAADTGPVPALSIAMLIVGSRGDVQPFIPIARRLKRDGHRVRIATHAVFREFVESHGLDFFPLAGDPRELMEYMVMTGGKLIPLDLGQLLEQVPRKRHVMGEILASTWAACTEPDPERPGATPFVADAVIANPPCQGHIHVAEALQAPLHIMFTMPWTPTRAFPHPFTHTVSEIEPGLRNLISFETFDLVTWLGISDLVNEFREHALGLERVHLGAHGAGLLHHLSVPHAYLWSAELLAKPDDWGAKIDVTGFIFLEDADRLEPQQSLQDFLAAGEPPVYIGFGSVPAADPQALTATIFEGLERAGARGLVARGWARIGGGAVPDHVYLIDEIPHDWLFPRCRAVCHHGGAGTTAAGLRYGRPTNIVPFFGDQHFWGAIVSQAGAGPPPVPIAELTVETLAAGIGQVLRPEVETHAAALGERIRSEKGEEAAVAAFYRHLPLAAMRCDVDPTHLARYRCSECELSLCRMCDAVIHEAPERAAHSRGLIGHVAWKVSGSHSVLERLERALCAPIDEDAAEPTEGGDPDALPPPALHGEESRLAELQRRVAAVRADDATRAKILAFLSSTLK
jgi:UDP:flavonoid glycosyltransferase YjiC (YdhE family)